MKTADVERVLIVGGYSIHGMLDIVHRGFTKIGLNVSHLPYMGELEDPAKLKAAVAEYRPDFIFGFLPERWHREDTIDALYSLPAPKLYHDFDMPQESMRDDSDWLLKIIKAFNVAVSTDDSEHTKAFFERADTPVHWCPPLFDADLASNIPPPALGLQESLSCVGSGYESTPYKGNRWEKHNRTDVAFELRKALGYEKVALFGFNWPEGWDRGKVDFYDQFDIYRSSGANWGTMIAVPPGPSRAMNFRPVLTLGAGGLLLQEWHEGLDQCFTDWEEIIYWDEPQELISRWRHISRYHSTARRIAEAGQQAVLSRYSNVLWAKRLVAMAVGDDPDAFPIPGKAAAPAGEAG